jgi:antitoxin ParD1/3/4
MPTMNVSLTDEMAHFVEDELGSGEYASASEVVRDALRLLRREKELEQEKLAVLRREIALGLEDVEAGRVRIITAREIADRVLREEPDAI